MVTAPLPPDPEIEIARQLDGFIMSADFIEEFDNIILVIIRDEIHISSKIIFDLNIFSFVWAIGISVF